MNGKKPVTPDMVLKKTIRPALERAGIKDKVIGWHSFRHSLATNLRAAGVDLKTAQELLRHANSRITLEVYTRAISATKRQANDRVMQMMLEAGTKQLSAPFDLVLLDEQTSVAGRQRYSPQFRFCPIVPILCPDCSHVIVPTFASRFYPGSVLHH